MANKQKSLGLFQSNRKNIKVMDERVAEQEVRIEEQKRRLSEQECFIRDQE